MFKQNLNRWQATEMPNCWLGAVHRQLAHQLASAHSWWAHSRANFGMHLVGALPLNLQEKSKCR